MLVGGARRRFGEARLLQLHHGARAGREQHGVIHAVLIEQLVPELDLPGRRQIAVIAIARHAERAAEIGIPGLAARPELAFAAGELPLEIARDIRRALEKVTVGVDRRKLAVLSCHDCRSYPTRMNPVGASCSGSAPFSVTSVRPPVCTPALPSLV